MRAPRELQGDIATRLRAAKARLTHLKGGHQQREGRTANYRLLISRAIFSYSPPKLIREGCIFACVGASERASERVDAPEGLRRWLAVIIFLSLGLRPGRRVVFALLSRPIKRIDLDLSNTVTSADQIVVSLLNISSNKARTPRAAAVN